MLVSEGLLKLAINLYPPLFFQRIHVVKFHKGFTGVDVKISKSMLNKNYNDSIFGGTIFSAADPFYPVLFYQVLIRKGYAVKGWSRSSAIRFVKPAHTNLYFSIRISGSELGDCERSLNTQGKFKKSYAIDILDENGQVCVSVINEIYLRDLKFTPYPEN